MKNKLINEMEKDLTVKKALKLAFEKFDFEGLAKSHQDSKHRWAVNEWKEFINAIEQKAYRAGELGVLKEINSFIMDRNSFFHKKEFIPSELTVRLSELTEFLKSLKSKGSQTS